MNGIFLKIITERKIPQHFKKSMVKIRFADNIKIIRAQAFLAGRGPGKPVNMPQKLRLKLLHAGGRKKHGRVILGHQGIAGNDAVAFGFKKVQEFCSDFVSCHNFFNDFHGTLSASKPRRNKKSKTLFFFLTGSMAGNLCQRRWANSKATLLGL